MEKIIKIFDVEKYAELLTTDLKVLHLHKIEEIEKTEVLPVNLDDLTISNSLTCSFCKINFDDILQQRQHYKSDWHRYNLKLNLKNIPPITEDNFEKLADDVSSISGSDTDDDSEPDTSLNALYQGKIYLKNNGGKVFAIYRSLIHQKKDVPANEENLIKLVKQSSKQLFWTLLMIGGGHFAGAVYDGDNVLVHKTFHLYTCRAKQGGAQYKEGNAKSAGASLRRYNELALNQHVAELLQNWTKYIEKSHLIFYRAAGPFNRTALFGGKNPAIKKTDARLRSIPFCTKRPTFTELKRVHDVLTNVEIYDSIESLKSRFQIQKQEESPRQSPVKNKTINRAKSRESRESIRPMPGVVDDDDVTSSSSSSDDEISLNCGNIEINLDDLREFEQTKREKNPPKKKKTKKKDRVKKWGEQLKRDLNDACVKGNIEVLKAILAQIHVDPNNGADQQITEERALNFAVDENGNTVLHVAALNNHNAMILWLLENNSSPCNKNDKQHTPYTINADKSVRGVFREYAAKNPAKYNYSKSQIPVVTSTLTDEQITEKKKAQRKAKRDREKEKKKENDAKRKEEEERNRYLKLSDREKRALAAERRLLAQTSKVLVRCFLCGEDISGKVPFEYSGNRFCSMSCLKAHRLQNPIVLS